MEKRSVQNLSWRERLWLYAPLFLWIGVIFYLSSSQGAMSNTSRFIRPFLEWMFPFATEETLQIYHGYIRKFAHFFEYAMLGFFASRAFWLSGRNPSVSAGVEQHTPSRSCFCLQNPSVSAGVEQHSLSRWGFCLQRFWYLFAFLLVVLIASIDETNQSFNAARTGSIYDVLLDASGGLTMIFLFWILTSTRFFGSPNTSHTSFE